MCRLGRKVRLLGESLRKVSLPVTGMSCVVPHHEGAVEMARVAVKNAEHPEIERLSERLETMPDLHIPPWGI